MTHESEQRVLNVGKLPADLLSRLITSDAAADPSVVIGPGIGRDAAAVTVGNSTLVIKTDPITFATENAPKYLVNVNANDLACLGSTPRWLSVTSLLPEHTTTPDRVERLFLELREACAECGVTLIGGHTEITLGLTRPILVGHMIGVAPESGLLAPGGARPGDRLLLTKGIAVEGTALLATELAECLRRELGTEFVARARRLLTAPGISIVQDARALLAAGGVTALHDPTEGGLAMGARELAIAAGCGVQVWRSAVPILPETAILAAHLGLEPIGMLASGSLLAAVAPARVDAAIAACRAAGIPASEVGVVTEARDGFTWTQDSTVYPLPSFDADEVSRALK